MADNLNDPFLRDVLRRLRALEVAQPVGFTSITRGALRVASPEGLIVQGSASVTGLLSGAGTLDWAGPWALRGAGSISGDVGIAGLLNVTGAAAFGSSIDVLSRLTVGANGYIEAGPVRIDRAGPYSGRVYSSGAYLLLASAGSVAVTGLSFIAPDTWVDDLRVNGNLTVVGAKNFAIPHPSDPDLVLQHGATESPVSGVEYWGEVEVGADGSAVVELPDYFEALVKPEGRAVLVSAVGRPFLTGYERIEDGQLVVYGDAGRVVSWLVKGERRGADFESEEPIIGPRRKE